MARVDMCSVGAGPELQFGGFRAGWKIAPNTVASRRCARVLTIHTGRLIIGRYSSCLNPWAISPTHSQGNLCNAG